jgi:hypothetical protein
MKKLTGWIIFYFGAVFTFACFGAAIFFFVESLIESGEWEVAAQLFGFICAVTGIPFYFLARYGWRLNHQVLPKTSHPNSTQVLSPVEIDKSSHDPTETILAVIEIIGDKALFFTQQRIIIADVEESAPGWAMPLLLFFPNAPSSYNNVKKFRKLPPEEILMKSNMNFAINYSGIMYIHVFRKLIIGRKIRIIAEYASVTPQSLSFRKRMTSGSENYQLELWLSKPWRWGKYANTLPVILHDKLEVS